MQASRILVPVKGTPVDDEVVQLACSIASATKAEVCAIHVIEVKRTLPLDAELLAEAEHGEDVLNHTEQIAERLGVSIGTDLLQARDVGPAIVDEAMDRGVDLIVMGISYKKRFGEFDLGSTTPYVLKYAPCRVWLCRQPV
ncbi:MAG: universal stress protein [Chloroflexi bacterium]|nr:universal stress protein [Chloroflexota bacterium]